MRTTVEATFNRPFWFIRLGRFAAHLERHPCAAPEGWLSVTPSEVEGVVMINIAKHTLHLEDHKRSAEHFATRRNNAVTA